MSSSNGGNLVLAGSEAGSGLESGTAGGGGGGAGAGDQSDDDQGCDLESSDSDSMGFDDDDNDGSDLMSNTTLGDDITAQLAAAGNSNFHLFSPISAISAMSAISAISAISEFPSFDFISLAADLLELDYITEFDYFWTKN